MHSDRNRQASVARGAVEHGPFLKDFHGAVPCTYQGHLRDAPAMLIGFAQSGYGYGWLAVIQTEGMTISVPMRMLGWSS